MSSVDHRLTGAVNQLHRRGLLFVAGAAFVWSSGGAIARMIESDAWTTVFWRSVTACIALLIYIAIRDRGRVIEAFRQLGWPGVVVALCFCTASTSFVVALNMTTVANILLIQATAPFIAGLLGWLLMGERVRSRSLLTMLLALIGIAIMVSDSVARGSTAGTILSFVIAFAFAGAVVTTRRHREVRMTPATCLATLFAAIVALPLAAPLSVSPGDLGYMTLFGAGQMAVGLILFTVGVRLVPAAEAALISVLETILGPIWVWLLFGENPGAYVILGGAIVVAALIAHTLLDWRDSRVVPPAA